MLALAKLPSKMEELATEHTSVDMQKERKQRKVTKPYNIKAIKSLCWG